MKTLDITFDFETCSLAPTAAVMSIGAVAWDRYNESDPFIVDEDSGDIDPTTVFSAHIDLRTSFVDGFTFDQSTADFWARQNDKAKSALIACDDALDTIENIITEFFGWIKEMKEAYGVSEVYLWSQGSDFDIAILKNICHKYNLTIPIEHTNFRDHRTFYLEGARAICDRSGVEYDQSKVYVLVEQLSEKGEPHDPVFDCRRSIFSTWQMMHHMNCLKTSNL